MNMGDRIGKLPSALSVDSRKVRGQTYNVTSVAIILFAVAKIDRSCRL